MRNAWIAGVAFVPNTYRKWLFPLSATSVTPPLSPPGGGHGVRGAGRPVRTPGVPGGQFGFLPGGARAAAMGAERPRRRPEVGAGGRREGARDGGEPAGRADREPADAAGAARV